MLERFVPEQFEEWLERTRELDKQRRSSERVTYFPGFGQHDEEAWQSWLDFVQDLLDQEGD